MLNKIYESSKKILKRNYKGIIFLICFTLIISYPVPYYIFTSGGISDLSSKFEIEEAYTQEGSYNLSYVTEINAQVLTFLLGKIIPSWDVVEISNYQITSDESLEEIAIRDKLSLEVANQTATFLAYSKAGKKIDIKKTNLYIIYTSEYLQSSEKIYIGDILTKVDGIEISTFEDLTSYIDNKEVGDSIKLEIVRGEKSIEITVLVQEVDGRKSIGIAIYKIYEYETDPKITFKFSTNESGSSAGLMTTLAIYDTLIEEDLTNGLKIAGTGTIDSTGVVGEIGGVSYKLKGAVYKNADVFLVPVGENYEECIKLKSEKNYNIKIVPVATLDDAINYLRSLKNEKE